MIRKNDMYSTWIISSCIKRGFSMLETLDVTLLHPAVILFYLESILSPQMRDLLSLVIEICLTNIVFLKQ